MPLQTSTRRSGETSRQLSGFLRTIVEVKVASCEQMTYGEFISRLPNPTSFNLLYASPSTAPCASRSARSSSTPSSTASSAARTRNSSSPSAHDRDRGTPRPGASSVRHLGPRRVLGQHQGPPVPPGREREQPATVQIVPPNEVVVVVGFELKMTNHAGTMNLCIPTTSSSPMGELSKQSWFNMGSAATNRQYASASPASCPTPASRSPASSPRRPSPCATSCPLGGRHRRDREARRPPRGAVHREAAQVPREHRAVQGRTRRQGRPRRDTRRPALSRPASPMPSVRASARPAPPPRPPRPSP